jgi:hypothetical protein
VLKLSLQKLAPRPGRLHERTADVSGDDGHTHRHEFCDHLQESNNSITAQKNLASFITWSSLRAAWGVKNVISDGTNRFAR